MRPDNRTPDQLRDVTLETGFSRHAEGSCLIKCGHTHVLCTATVEERVPGWMKGNGSGWVTAEYGMLPRSTHSRMRREVTAGKASGRTQEIQRLIGRSLRAVTDLRALGERQVYLDCDVIQADGGTRTAAITGAWVALKQATDWLVSEGVLAQSPLSAQVAAISCGIIDNEPRLDLEYEEDSNAEVDANFILSSTGQIIEIQATGEERSFTDDEFAELMRLAKHGTGQLFDIQKSAI